MRSMAMTATKTPISYKQSFFHSYTYARKESFPLQWLSTTFCKIEVSPVHGMPRFKAALHLPPPIDCPPWCVEESATIAFDMRNNHDAKKAEIAYILSLLNEKYVFSLPQLAKDTHDPNDFSPKHLRWLMYSSTSKLLGWKKGRPKGNVDGFSDKFYGYHSYGGVSEAKSGEGRRHRSDQQLIVTST